MGFGRRPVDLDLGINLTPLIDCCFQLIVFFIVTIDMSQKELEDLRLPAARAAVPDQPPTSRPIVNVDSEGRTFIRGRLVYDPESPDPRLRDTRGIEEPLALWARAMPQRYDEFARRELPDHPLLLRADRNTPFRHIQRILELCSKEGIRIWKVELAAAEEKEEGR
ncbi:MAG TPA: biopolymer transporter ExbD [Planctomycetota bacterium]|nr:biopolymer transporter ExbD [Planctomycetota bacterium]